MALPVITNVHRCALDWAGPGGQHAENVIHVRGVDTDPDAIMTWLDANVTSDMWAIVCSSAHIATVSITPLDGTTATQQYVPATPSNWDGGIGGDSVPQGSSLVKLTTLSRGRSYRGRVFLPFLPESAQADGKITSALLGDQQDAWDAFVAAGAGGAPQLVIASYLHSTAERVSAALCEEETATQRRRQSRNR